MSRLCTGNRIVAVSVLLLALFTDLMDNTIVNVALPAIEQDVGAVPEQLEWIVGGYMLAFAALLVTGGRLGDILGRRRVFVVGVIGFTAASLLVGPASEQVRAPAAPAQHRRRPRSRGTPSPRPTRPAIATKGTSP